MRISRVAWALLAVAAAGLALFMYSQTREKPAAHTVTLRWSPSEYATSYNVYRATASGGPYRKIGSAPTTVYIDGTVSSGTVVYYVVTADCKGHESKYSKEVEAAIPRAAQ